MEENNINENDEEPESESEKEIISMDDAIEELSNNNFNQVSEGGLSNNSNARSARVLHGKPFRKLIREMRE